MLHSEGSHFSHPAFTSTPSTTALSNGPQHIHHPGEHSVGSSESQHSTPKLSANRDVPDSGETCYNSTC